MIQKLFSAGTYNMQYTNSICRVLFFTKNKASNIYRHQYFGPSHTQKKVQPNAGPVAC
jgi:hypothetical protein